VVKRVPSPRGKAIWYEPSAQPGFLMVPRPFAADCLATRRGDLTGNALFRRGAGKLLGGKLSQSFQVVVAQLKSDIADYPAHILRAVDHHI
jgi:hypothetical protein